MYSYPYSRIYLTGMPGSGKTTLGKQLSKLLGYEFYDLDAEIEKQEGKSVPEIFQDSGEHYFRNLETLALRNLTLKKTLIATGGGTPCFSHNMDFMLENGLVIFLDAPVSILAERVQRQQGARPLLPQQTLPELHAALSEKLDARRHFYDQAHIRLDVTLLDPFQAANLIRPYLEE